MSIFNLDVFTASGDLWFQACQTEHTEYKLLMRLCIYSIMVGAITSDLTVPDPDNKRREWKKQKV